MSDRPHSPGGLIGECKPIRDVLEDLDRIAPTSAAVLVAGESGTGKELVARAVHELSGRGGPFIAVNCGAIAPDLLASHLFGHERGSFTGAATRHIGFFEQANGGTLFLDEVTEMCPSLQVYLLRALETGAITRVGAVDQVCFDARIVAATNRNAMMAIDDGHLREDLFYRLADFIVDLPPLRERGDDVVLLARHFVALLNVHHGQHKRLSDDSVDVLCSYDWPGNVRELKSVVQRCFILSDSDPVRIRIPDHGTGRLADHEGGATVTFSVGMSYAEMEQKMLLKTLERFGNDKTRAARALGVSVRTIHNQLARFRSDDVVQDARRRSDDNGDLRAINA